MLTYMHLAHLPVGILAHQINVLKTVPCQKIRDPILPISFLNFVVSRVVPHYSQFVFKKRLTVPHSKVAYHH